MAEPWVSRFRLLLLCCAAHASACAGRSDVILVPEEDPVGDYPDTFRQLSAGDRHTCGLSTQGWVFCWGSNSSGQLGDGGQVERSSVPVLLATPLASEPEAFVQLAAGNLHTCGLTTAGALYCWGATARGQLGTGDTQGFSATPMRVEPSVMPPRSIAGVTAGASHTCALTAAGVAYCWGSNSTGQLGHGGDRTEAARPVAVDVTALSGYRAFKQITAGDSHTCGLTGAGRAFCWGNDSKGQLGNTAVGQDSLLPVSVDTSTIVGEQSFKALVAGREHTCGLTGQGAVYCWGSDAWGQLGAGNADDTGATPVRVDLSVMGDHAGVIQLSARGDTSCAVSGDRGLYCWGGGAQTPVAVEPDAIPGAERFLSVSVGRDHVCGLTVEHLAVCWGEDTYGQLGNGSNEGSSSVPVAVKTHTVATAPPAAFDPTAFIELSGGAVHTCGLTATSQAYCWGRDELGRLGDGGVDTTAQTPVAVDRSTVAGSGLFASVTAGVLHSCGITIEGEAYCWGEDTDGQLGDGGASVNSRSPVAVDLSGLPGEQQITLVTLGYHAACGLNSEGVAYCWGADNSGALGDGGGSVDSQAPVPVATGSLGGDAVFVQLTAGADFSCGLSATGNVYCWGLGGHGQLGDGAGTTSGVPLPLDTSGIAGDKAFIHIKTMDATVCGVTAEGVGYCWGYNINGQVGNPAASGDSVLSPVAVDTSSMAGDNLFSQILPAGNHTCGLTVQGNVYCWGLDDYGTLGDGGTAVASNLPVAVDTSEVRGTDTFIEVTAGFYHACSLTADHVAHCWGRDHWGQLGNGGTSGEDAFSPEPVDVSGI